MKKLLLFLASTLMAASMSLVSLAGSWQQDTYGWRYLNDNGTYSSSSWQWIDGNGDGIAEDYYFDANGYCLMNGTAPDGSTVNADGAWTVDGVVQTQVLSSQALLPPAVSETLPVSPEAAQIPEAIPQTAADAEPIAATVWHSRTGSKYHSNPSCSNMKNPIESTLDQAIAQGRDACSKCW